MKVKIFNCIFSSSEDGECISETESAINEFIKGKRVVRVLQSSTFTTAPFIPGLTTQSVLHFMITIFYEE